MSGKTIDTESLDRSALQFALGHFFSSEVTPEKWDQILEANEEGEGLPEDVTVWEPFQNYPVDWIVEQVEALQRSLASFD